MGPGPGAAVVTPWLGEGRIKQCCAVQQHWTFQKDSLSKHSRCRRRQDSRLEEPLPVGKPDWSHSVVIFVLFSHWTIGPSNVFARSYPAGSPFACQGGAGRGSHLSWLQRISSFGMQGRQWRKATYLLCSVSREAQMYTAGCGVPSEHGHFQIGEKGPPCFARSNINSSSSPSKLLCITRNKEHATLCTALLIQHDRSM